MRENVSCLRSITRNESNVIPAGIFRGIANRLPIINYKTMLCHFRSQLKNIFKTQKGKEKLSVMTATRLGEEVLIPSFRSISNQYILIFGMGSCAL